jgi:hypothetical protein
VLRREVVEGQEDVAVLREATARGLVLRPYFSKKWSKALVAISLVSASQIW